MPHEWEELDDEVAAASICPMPDCGALVVAYRSADDVGRDHAEPQEFTCPRCGTDFTVPEDELIFHSVPKDWLLARVHAAQSPRGDVVLTPRGIVIRCTEVRYVRNVTVSPFSKDDNLFIHELIAAFPIRFLHNIDTLIVLREAEKLFGDTREQLVGKSGEALVPPRFCTEYPRHRENFFGDPRVRPLGCRGGGGGL